MRLPGLGPKTARRIWQELGITTVAALKSAAEAEQLRGHAGIGPGTEKKIAEALAKPRAAEGPRRALLGTALPKLRAVVDVLREHPASVEVSIAGSARRMRETVRDLDVIATATDPQALVDYFCALRWVVDVAREGTDQGDGRLARRVAVRPARRAAGVLRQPASALHRLEAPQRRVARGRGAARLLDLGVLRDGRRERRGAQVRDARRRSTASSATPGSRRSCARTAASWRPRAATSCRGSSSYATCSGDLHTHTTWSDGKDSLEDMVAAAPAARLRVLRDLRPLAATARRSAAAAVGADRRAQRAASRRSGSSRGSR